MDLGLDGKVALVAASSKGLGMALRVRLARRLLAGGTPPSVVATLSGFYDQAHLSKVFKRYTGVTPRQFSCAAQVATDSRQEGT